MEYGIQRRSVYLTPPLGAGDVDFILDAFDLEEVWSMFGHDRPARAHMAQLEDEGRMIRGIIRRVADDRRIGFTLFFAPPDWLGLEETYGTWEYGMVIPDRRDRNGFSGIHAADAMAHYIVDHLRRVDWWWRIRADNGASRAIARRMGYASLGTWRASHHEFAFYRMTQATWERRRAALERGEARAPSPLGAAFLTLEGPPYVPVRSTADEGSTVA